MDEYDRKAWEALERERQRELEKSSRRLVPGPVRERAGGIARRAHERASSVPGFDAAEDLLEEVLRAAGDVGAKLAADSLWQSRIIAAYEKAGHPVELVTDIQQLTPLRYLLISARDGQLTIRGPYDGGPSRPRE